VETGWDLFAKDARHIPTICFYETGYNLFTLRRRSDGRAHRQKNHCRIVTSTMRAHADGPWLMGKKLTAAQRSKGRFLQRRAGRHGRRDANVEIPWPAV